MICLLYVVCCMLCVVYQKYKSVELSDQLGGRGLCAYDMRWKAQVRLDSVPVPVQEVLSRDVQSCSIFFLLVFLTQEFLFQTFKYVGIVEFGRFGPKNCGSCSDPNYLPKHGVVTDQ